MPRKGKAAELARWVGEHRPARIGEAEYAELRRVLAPISESYLHRLVKDCGVPLAPLVAGVRQGNLDELEASLRLLADEYERAGAVRRNQVRQLVITAKDHARLAARNPARRAEKEEVVLWLTTWLENPPLFRSWVAVRRSLVGGLLHE